MCGLAGIVGPAAGTRLGRAMARSLAHRGPDGSGVFRDGDAVLAHSRLSILDLETGDQPMADPDASMRLVYNGEIYNFRELRSELEGLGHRFRTSSDSEVLIEGFKAWGLDLMPRLDGMFAFALWLREPRRLILARDPFGIKPLHYHWDGSSLRFASEIKAILQDPRVRREVDRHALHAFLNLRYVPGERTLLRGVRRLPPGHALVLENGRFSLLRYHREPRSEEPSRAARASGRRLAEYEEGIRHHLSEAVRKQMVSDVPLGAYLSGGLDSSSIVALMRRHTSAPIPTFCLGFGEPTDELAEARSVAEHFATDHRELRLGPEPLRHFPAGVWAAEEPKENILQGYLLARFARDSVKAVHGGLGGDELFAGYNVHRFLAAAGPLHPRVPRGFSAGPMRALSGALYALQSASGVRRWDQYRRGLQLLSAIGDPCRFYLILRNAWDLDRGAYRLYGPAWRGFEPETTTERFA
ncbi:MAG: asparagine synthase (glutamine-hydrolyzing), partial [Acidobacteriota bacterium]